MLNELRVEPGAPARLAERDTDDRLGVEKHDGEERLAINRERIDALQYRLHAEGTRSVLLVLQGLDASGKDGVIRRVFAGVNLIGVESTIGVFNRSHYEDVVAVRMRELAPEAVWRRRYEHIRAFERTLVDEGTAVLKVFLNVSREMQRTRLQERIDDPEKRWKFRHDDLDVHERYDEWVSAWDDALTETSTDWSPWHVVPADRNWVKALAVAQLLCRTLEGLDPQLPEPEEGIEGLRVE